MLYKVFGDPISIVRYVLNWQMNKIISLEYRTSDKDFKITSSVDNNKNITVNLQGKTDGNILDFPIGNITFMKLEEYKTLFKNRVEGKTIPPCLNIIKNKSCTDNKMIDIPFGDYDMEIPLGPNCNAVFYTDHVSIFNYNGREIAKYYIFDDGIYEIADKLANFTYLSKEDGRSSGSFSVDRFLGHEDAMPSLRLITPIAKFPLRLINESNYNVNLAYDIYGLMINLIDNNIDIQSYYTSEYRKNDLRIRESVHHLIYDNFDMSQHYYNTRKAVAESVKINEIDNELEYIRVIFDNVEQIKEVNEYEFREQDNFYTTIDKCFKY